MRKTFNVGERCHAPGRQNVIQINKRPLTPRCRLSTNLGFPKIFDYEVLR